MFAYLDKLTQAVTAFRTWVEFFESMEKGYVPTIYPTTRRNRQLIRIVRVCGFRTFPN